MTVTSLKKQLGLPSRMANGLTPKQEAFARLVADGATLSDAYRKAYSAGGKAITINNTASKLAKQPHIAARIDALLKEAMAIMVRDSVAIRRHVFSGLMKESRNMDAKPSERIAALVSLGKIDVVSMFREQRTIEDRMERKPSEVEEELRSKLRELFRGETIEHYAEEVGPERATEPPKVASSET